MMTTTELSALQASAAATLRTWCRSRGLSMPSADLMADCVSAGLLWHCEGRDAGIGAIRHYTAERRARGKISRSIDRVMRSSSLAGHLCDLDLDHATERLIAKREWSAAARRLIPRQIDQLTAFVLGE